MSLMNFFIYKTDLNSKLHEKRKKERTNPSKFIFSKVHIDYTYPDNLLKWSRAL